MFVKFIQFIMTYYIILHILIIILLKIKDYYIIIYYNHAWVRRRNKIIKTPWYN